MRKDDNGTVTVNRLPKDLQAGVAALGKYDLDPNSSDDENGRWFMYEEESEPFAPEADARIPVRTILPGVIIAGKFGNGIVSGHDLGMWAAVFDHAQTRHTVYARAVRVVTQD